MDSDIEPIIADPKLRIVSREEWGALEATSKEPIKLPAHRLFSTTTNTKRCMTKAQCVQSAREIQQFYMSNKGWPDLPYSFLVGGDLRVYEGRGWGVKIREAAEPMEQPLWKTGRVVVGYITKANDNSKHMNKMLDTGYKLMEFGIDNNYLVDFRKHFPFRSVDYDNELEVEKYEEVAKKVGNQCYQGFVPENEVIFDPTDDEGGSSFELKTEDENEGTGDIFAEIEKEKMEEMSKKAEKIKKKVEDVYGCSDVDSVDREKRARTYGEEEYAGDYSDEHFEEDTGSTSELGHTTDEGKTGEMFDFPAWVTAKEDFDDDGLKEKPEMNKKYDKTENKGQTVSDGGKPLDAPSVNDELKTLIAELKRHKEGTNNNKFNNNNNGNNQSKGISDKNKHNKVRETNGKNTNRHFKEMGALKDLVGEFERHRDSKNRIEYGSEDSDGVQLNNRSGMCSDKAGDQIDIPVASGLEAEKSIIGGRESKNLESKDNNNSNVDKISNDKIYRKKPMKKRRKARDENISNKYSAKSFSGIHSSGEENPKKVELLKELTAKAKELERERAEIGDFSPNDSDDYNNNSGEENRFMKDCENMSKDTQMDNFDSIVVEEKPKPVNVKHFNADASTVINTTANSITENANQTTDQNENNVQSLNNIQDQYNNLKPTTDRTSEDSFQKINEITKEEANRNLIMGHQHYFTRVNIAVIKRYLSERNKSIGTYRSHQDLKLNGEETEPNYERGLGGIPTANNDQKINNRGPKQCNQEDNVESKDEKQSENHKVENYIEKNVRNVDKIQRSEDLNTDNNINVLKFGGNIEATKKSEGPLDENVSGQDMQKKVVYEKYRRGSHFENEEQERYYKEKVKPFKNIKRDTRSDKEVNTQIDSLLEDLHGPNVEKYNVPGTYYDKKLGYVDSSPLESVTELESSEIDPMDFNK